VGAPLIHVEWYSSVKELVHGLEKNVFSGCSYNLGIVAAGVLGQVWLFQWPFVGLLVSTGTAFWAYFASVLALTGMAAAAAWVQRLPLKFAVGLPLSSMMFTFIILRSTILNIIEGGITWRGTFYPLEALKKNRI
jgi:hypothetical protein